MEYSQWEHELSEWHSPEAFNGKLRRLRTERGDYLLTDRGTQFFREAYCAQAFALLVEAQQVRLVDAVRPDFAIDVSGVIRAYEVTEADTPGRKRTEEIKAARAARNEAIAAGKLNSDVPSFTDVSEGEWLTPEVAETALRTATGRKNKSHYDPSWGLLIFLNPGFNTDQQAIEAGMAPATAAAKDRFREVWVLWQGAAYNTWLCGALSNRVIPRPTQGEED
jgi:hypothetical protein